MENKPLKLNNKVSTELLGILAKTVGVLRDIELNEAFNRIEIQVKEYEETNQPCDLTYLRDLCNQFDDKLTSVCKAKSEMAKLMMTPDMLERMGISPDGGQEPGQKTESKGTNKIGFRS